MSWFSQIASTVTNIAGISEVSKVRTAAETSKEGQYYSELVDKDYEWTLASGSSTENQIFYITTPTGGFMFVQLIHSSIGLWKPTISFAYRYYEPHLKINKFKNYHQSSEFKLSADRRSVKTEYFNITLNPELTEFTISIRHPDVIIDLNLNRIDKGFKVGEGKTYLGDKGGIVSHKFWPRCVANGKIMIDKKMYEVNDGYGMFIHSIQGMQPQLIASKWNFINFQSETTALSIMQFTTTKQYGCIEVNQGSVMLNNKLVSVCVDNKVELLDMVKDKDTKYEIPQKVKLSWKGQTIKENEEDVPVDVSITMTVNTKNLIDKIDILAEVPYVIRKLLQSLIVKPYIYQWLDEAVAEIVIGDQTIQCPGKCYQELVFVSDF